MHNRPLLKEKNQKVFELMKDELGGKIKEEFVRLRAKTYSYLIDDGNEDKKQKAQKSATLKKLNLEIIKIV